MPQDFRVAIRLDADTKGFQSEIRLGAKALGRLTGSTDRASAAARRLARTSVPRASGDEPAPHT